MRKKMTDEERKAHREEYMRAYREKNAERIKELKREHYHRKTAVVRTYTCVVCGRELPQEMFLDSKGRRMHGGTCNECRNPTKRKTRVGNGNGKRSEYTRRYYQEHKEELTQKNRDDYLRRRAEVIKREVQARKERLCEKCPNWPCFDGIENLETDFARLGCHGFPKQGEAS